MSASGRMDLTLSFNQDAPAGIGSVLLSTYLRRQLSFINGNGALPGHISQVWAANRTLAAGANETLDLSGVLNQTIGTGTFDATKVKLLYIRLPDVANQSAAVRFGPNASQGFNGPLTTGSNFSLSNGTEILATCPTIAGFTVTGGSSDKIRVENMDLVRAASYTIIVAAV